MQIAVGNPKTSLALGPQGSPIYAIVSIPPSPSELVARLLYSIMRPYSQITLLMSFHFIRERDTCRGGKGFVDGT